MKGVDFKKLGNEVEDFSSLRDVRKDLKREHSSSEKALDGSLLRRALSEGFFMNTARCLPSQL